MLTFPYLERSAGGRISAASPPAFATSAGMAAAGAGSRAIMVGLPEVVAQKAEQAADVVAGRRRGGELSAAVTVHLP